MGNWNRKEELKKRAVEHTTKMEKEHAIEIQDCIAKTVIYPPQTIGRIWPDWDRNNRIKVMETDTVSALFSDCISNTTILNFSSYKNSGGMFYEGSSAQEEMLCHESFLYNVLKEFTEPFYEQNKKQLNRALYKNNLLYSPDVLFIRDDNRQYANVITCAAPNKEAAQKYQNVSNLEVNNAMRERIRRILYVAYINDTSRLILGAYGCGVFGNDPHDVATIFKEELMGEFDNCFDEIIFSIPGGENYRVFKAVFDRAEKEKSYV